jgi:hypothetical protein
MITQSPTQWRSSEKRISTGLSVKRRFISFFDRQVEAVDTKLIALNDEQDDLNETMGRAGLHCRQLWSK